MNVDSVPTGVQRMARERAGPNITILVNHAHVWCLCLRRTDVDQNCADLEMLTGSACVKKGPNSA